MIMMDFHYCYQHVIKTTIIAGDFNINLLKINQKEIFSEFFTP